MSTMQVSQRLSIREVDPSDLELRGWVNTMQSRLPHATQDLTAPSWVGLYFEDRLFAAISYIHRADRTVFIDGLVCRPHRLGRTYAVALWLAMKHQWAGRRITFCVALNNRKMINALTQYTSAKPVAAVFEMEA